MKIKLKVRAMIIAIRFDEKSFLVLFLVLPQDEIINTIISILVKKL